MKFNSDVAFALLAVPVYISIRLYLESSKRLVRLAREETEILYRHVLAGAVRLSEDAIERALQAH